MIMISSTYQLASMRHPAAHGLCLDGAIGRPAILAHIMGNDILLR